MQHMKAAFYAWTFASLVEVALRRSEWRRVFDANLLINLLAPWAMFLWYLASALDLQPLPSTAIEIAYANAVLFFAGAGLSVLARGVMAAFYLLVAFLLATFSFKTPWGGFFVHP